MKSSIEISVKSKKNSFPTVYLEINLACIYSVVALN
jgi:hypothetical protein